MKPHCTQRATAQSLAADGAIAYFSSNLIPSSLMLIAAAEGQVMAAVVCKLNCSMHSAPKARDVKAWPTAQVDG